MAKFAIDDYVRINGSLHPKDHYIVLAVYEDEKVGFIYWCRWLYGLGFESCTEDRLYTSNTVNGKDRTPCHF